MSEHSTQLDKHPGYGLFVGIWAALVALTATTVWVAGINLGFWNVVAALAVATTKASLVVFFFMHLKYEGLTLKLMVLTAFVILSIFIGMTFFDTAYR